jgi:hypothetical protein
MRTHSDVLAKTIAAGHWGPNGCFGRLRLGSPAEHQDDIARIPEGVARMPRGSSPKRERQYEHIKESAKGRGESTGRAEEIAARTVNKERARSGEARTASRSSTDDMSSSRRGGKRSHSGAAGPTYAQLYAEARRRKVDGRSSMNKAQLQRALGR